MRFRAAAVLISCLGCAAREPAAPSAAAGTASLRSGDFALSAWDSGTQRRRCVLDAPWGSSSWGIEASTFSDRSDHTLALSRFVLDDGVARLHGKESDGRWGFVRYVQGDVWGGSHCGPIPWNRAIDRTLTDEAVVDLVVYREKSALSTKFSSWVMFAVNLWFSSPSFPAGKDKQRKKPLVMDLLFHHRCNTPFCGPRHYVDEAAYHYQESVGEAPHRQWVTLEIPVGRHLAAALRRFDLPTHDVSLQQIEVLIELRHAEGAMRIDAFQLWL